MEQLYHPVTIGSLVVPGNLFLAPVAGFSDDPFRTVCLKRGASLAYTEMVSCEGIVRENKKTLDLLLAGQNETDPAVQLFGADPETAAEAVRRILPFSPVLIDFNCGCPVPKVVKTGAGSALMKDPGRMARILAALRTALDQAGFDKIPVTVKIRSGWDQGSINFLETAKNAEDAGVAAVTLHPRTRSQGYSGTSDWAQIAMLKDSLKIPVFGSGDLFSPQAAERMLTQTGCDGIMFARGAIGHPFIFYRSRLLLETGNDPGEPTLQELRETIEEHLCAAVARYGETQACRQMRKHLCAYTKGLRGGGAIRNQVSLAGSMADYRDILQNLTADAG